MIKKAVIFDEYWFVPARGGTDYLEGHEETVSRLFGKGVVHFHNKKGGVLRMMFPGDMSSTKKAILLRKVEEACKLIYINQKEVQYQPEFEKILKNQFGEKLVVK